MPAKIYDFYGDWLMNDFGELNLTGAFSALGKAIIWTSPTDENISIAAFTDDATIIEADLMQGLSERECERAHDIADPVEKRHFVVRRSFQRVFVKSVLKSDVRLGALKLEHQLDRQPQCLDAPGLRLSFSSSGQTAVACAATHCRVGIDVEKLRPIENVVGLAQRFFTKDEAAFIAATPIPDQNVIFLKHWTAKEAGLKAIGKGVVFGLNRFTLTLGAVRQIAENNGDSGACSQWQLNHMSFLPGHIVAVVHSLENSP